jgi:outer membrane lipoprotein-sorting protein
MKNIKFPILAALLLLLIVSSAFKKPSSLPSGDEIVKNVNSRDEGKHLVQQFSMELIDKGGKTQTRDTKAYRKDFSDQRKTIVVYLNPTTVKGTAFMSYDYFSAKEDDQWLYLPALRKTRRISASNRGDYFLGTDFTYEDIKLGTKLSATDYKRSSIKEEAIDGHKCYLVESVPVSEKIGKELGYSKVHQWIDAEIWIVRKAQYWDVGGNLLKTTTAQDIKKVQGIWTIHGLNAFNHKSNHKTNLKFSGADYVSDVSDDLFSEESLERGVN